MHDGSWAETRRRQTEFVDRTPTVLVVGAGHTGLEIAARLKYIGVDALVVEKNARIGDNVRGTFFRFSFVRALVDVIAGGSGGTDIGICRFMILFVSLGIRDVLSVAHARAFTEGYNTPPILPFVPTPHSIQFCD
jgi:hypothetical protein